MFFIAVKSKLGEGLQENRCVLFSPWGRRQQKHNTKEKISSLLELVVSTPSCFPELSFVLFVILSWELKCLMFSKLCSAKPSCWCMGCNVSLQASFQVFHVKEKPEPGQLKLLAGRNSLSRCKGWEQPLKLRGSEESSVFSCRDLVVVQGIWLKPVHVSWQGQFCRIVGSGCTCWEKPLCITWK